MKFWPMQPVVNALAADEKIRHSISGLDLEVFIARVLAERAVPVIDSDLGNQREDEIFNRVEAEDVFCHGR
jgi:hypothetical protein